MVQIPESSVLLKTIDGKEITVKFKSVLTAFDAEIIQKSLLDSSKADSGKTFLDVKRVELETMLTGWSLETPLNLEELKQNISLEEYVKLNDAIKSITESKKK